MTASRIAVGFLLLLGVACANALPEQGRGSVSHGNNDPIYLQLRNIRVGSENIHVKDFTLKKDAGVFVFRSGVFSFLEPVNGKITGAIFQGDASFSLTPPTSIEKRNLAILTKGQPFEEQFSNAVFRFTDGTEQEIRKAAAADNSPLSGNGATLLDDGTEYPSYKFEHSFSNDPSGDVVLNFKLTQSDVSKDFVMLVPLYIDLGDGRVASLGSARLSGNTSIEQHVPLRGLKQRPKRALIAYYDDILGNIENR